MKCVLRTSHAINNDFVHQLLIDRNIIGETPEEYNLYRNPIEDMVHDTELLDHISDVTVILLGYIKGGGNVIIPVDSDVDGFTSAAVMYLYMKEMNDKYGTTPIKFDYLIPEGKEHGLATRMEWFRTHRTYGPQLIILPDSSSNDYSQHEELRKMGYIVVVIDHHEAEKYSENAIVINNQLSKNYPNKALSGVGVVWKVLKHIDKVMNWGNYSDKYLDLVALGEISDMMNMSTPENRYILQKGLNNIQNDFFKELLTKQSYSMGEGPITQIGIAFYITPPINALIRVGNQVEKENLFKAFINGTEIVPSTKRGEKGKEEKLSTQSARNCINAKARQNREKEKAIDLLDMQILENCYNDNKILILNADDLNVSTTLTGLCAMGVAAKYKKPVILGRIDSNGILKGSMRGQGESELVDFRQFLLSSGLVNYVEGHANAAGVGIKVSNIDKLYDYANKELANINFNEGFYEIDFVASVDSNNFDELVEDLELHKGFFGQGNPEPKILLKDIVVEKNDIIFMGENKDTIKIMVNGVACLKFKDADLADELRNANYPLGITAVGQTNTNYWNGRKSYQIFMNELEYKELLEGF